MTDTDAVRINAAIAHGLGAYAAIVADFAEAAFAVPAFGVAEAMG